MRDIIINSFKIANLNTDRNLLELANKNANYIVSKGLLDGGSSAENFKLLLHLFNQDRAIKYLEAGYSFSGITNPAEIINFAASSTDISSATVSSFGTNNKQ